MANVNVTYDEMQGAATRLRAGQQQATETLQHLQQQVDELVAGGFVTDQASGAFQESYQEFTSGTTQAVAGIEGMAHFLEQAAQTLQDVDAQLAAGLRG